MNPSTLVLGGGIGSFFLSFLLVFSVLYALLQKTKILSDRIDINAVISLAIAFSVAIFPSFSGFVIQYAPYVGVVLVFIALAFVIFGFFGAKPEEVLKLKSVVGIIIGILVIGAFVFLGNMWSQTFVENATVKGNASNPTQTSAQANKQYMKMCSDYSKLNGAQAVACMLGDPVFLGVLITLILMFVAVYVLVVPPSK